MSFPVRRRPGALRSFAFLSSIVAFLLGGAALAAADEAIDGLLTVQWADPRPGHEGGDVRFQITRADGATVPVTIAAAARGNAFAAFGRRVRLEGGLAAGTDGVERFAATSVTALEAEAPAAAAPTVRRVLYVLLRYKGDGQMPHAAAFYRALTNPKVGNASLKIPATVNGFFDKTSWNRLLWRADVAGTGGLAATGWLTLPGTKTDYAPCKWNDACADLGRLTRDAMALVAKVGVDATKYDNISFVLNNDLDCCAWGGSFYFGGKSYGGTWEPPWGQDASTYVHEYGHSIGLPHSGWRYYAYDSPWDEMSGGTVASRQQCGSYTSANSGEKHALSCVEPGSGYIGAHKEHLGWLPPANVVVVNAKSVRTVDLEATALGLGTRPKMIRICLPGRPCTGGYARFLTVEARRPLAQYEKGLPGDGVVLHDVDMNRSSLPGGNSCFFNFSFGWAIPIDATPGDWVGPPTCGPGNRAYPNYALFNAQFDLTRKTYANAGLGIRVEVLAKTTNGYRVRVTRSK